MSRWINKLSKSIRGGDDVSRSPGASLSSIATDGMDADDERDDEFAELLGRRAQEKNGKRASIKGSPTKKRITRSKIGSVDNLTAFVTNPRASHLSNRHVKYQTRPKIKAPATHWVSIDNEGVVTKVTADKRAITKAKELGVTTRELRMFDQIYGHVHNNSTRILVRENALLFVMEGYRLIITTDEVFIPLFGLPPETLSDLIKELEYVLSRRHGILNRLHEEREAKDLFCLKKMNSNDSADEEEDEEEEILPFELRVFEVALGRVVANFKNEIVDLDERCHPALEALTQRVDKVTLDHVRLLKNKHSTLTKKVEAVVEELERIMDDDDDMRRMVLSSEDMGPFLLEAMTVTPRSTPKMGSFRSIPTPREGKEFAKIEEGDEEQSNNGLRSLKVPRSSSFAKSDEGDHDRDHDQNLMIVENLLEFYFAILDHAFDCLKTLEEIIDNTEEMIDIELDTARNRLIKLEILLTGCTFTFTIYAVVAGVLGENLELPESITSQFWLVNLITILFCGVVMSGLWFWCRYENLL